MSTVLEELALPFKLADFQEIKLHYCILDNADTVDYEGLTVQLQVFGVNALLNGFDVISVIPTGSGKTLVIFLFALALPKMLSVANTMVVVGITHYLHII